MAQRRKIYTGRMASTIIMVAALYLCSLSIYFYCERERIVGGMIGDVRLSVEVSDSMRVDPTAMRLELEKIDGVRSAQFIYTTQADANFSKHIGIDINSFMGERVLPSTFVVSASSSENLDELSAAIQQNSWAKDVYYERSIVDNISKKVDYITTLLAYITIIIALFAFIVIFYTVRLMIGGHFNSYPYNRPASLNKMAYRWAWVSATISSIFTGALLYFTIAYTEISLPELGLSMDKLPMILAGTVVASTSISLLSTAFSLLSQNTQR